MRRCSQDALHTARFQPHAREARPGREKRLGYNSRVRNASREGSPDARPLPDPMLPMKALLGLVLLFLSALASAAEPAMPQVAARSWLLYDFVANQVLLAHNADERVEPASLTKLMTAYIVFGEIRQKKITREQTVPVSQRAWKAEGSRMFIEPRKPVTVDELLHGMIVQSGNDASIALAELVAGSEEAFAELMNKEGKRLGMNGTRFANATGLPSSQHYSTASDLAKLAAAVIRDFPEFYPLYSLKDYTYNKIKQSNRNRLLWRDPSVDGVKTGLTEAAGHCLVASAKRGERRLVSVVLGASSDAGRAAESQKLLNFGFQFYETVRLYEKGKPVEQLQVWKGSAPTVPAGFAEDLFFAIPKGQSDKLKASLESQQPLLAPVSAGQRLGTMKITLDGKPLAEVPVVATEAVGVGNVFARAWDSLRLLFK